MAVDWLSFGFAGAVAGGGVLGYVKAGSTVSLAMGLLFGSILGYGAYQTSANPNNYYVTLGTSAVLAGVMGNRYLQTGKLMPAGMVAALSVAMVLRFSARAIGLVPVKSK